MPDGKHFTSSPWANNGRVFCLDEDGVTFVVRAGDKFELLGKNPLGRRRRRAWPRPRWSATGLLIRTVSRVYCIRKTASGETKAGG